MLMNWSNIKFAVFVSLERVGMRLAVDSAIINLETDTD
jgi:hypothetical protein